MPTWGVWLLGIGLFAWSMGAAIWIEGRVHRWYVARSRGSAVRAALLILGTHLGWTVVALLVLGIARALEEQGHSSAWVVLPAIAAYGPVAFLALPMKFSGYREVRGDLEAAGATKGVSRALTWPGGPFVIVLLCACVAGFIDVAGL